MSPCERRPTVPRVSRRWARICLPLASLGVLSAAPAAAINGQAGAGFVVAEPRGELGESIEKTGFGGEVHGGVWLGPSPVMIGGKLDIINYGNESRREPFSLTIPDVEVEVNTTNMIYGGHLFLRLEPRIPTVRPYVEGVVGFKYFQTTTKIQEINSSDPDPIAESTNLDDGVFSWGGSGGLMVHVWSSVGSGTATAPAPAFDLWLDLGVSYQGGGEADYLKEGAITRGPDGVEYDVSRSSTELLVYLIGATITF